jgi:molybdopterin biosynthesis enzyme MoaB
MEITRRAMLSRGVAGLRESTLVVNVPGSPKAATESLALIADQLEHAVEMIAGSGHD